MTSFLQLVAQDLRRRMGDDLSRTIIVFPNKRAGLFMNDYLVSLADGAPVWAPRYLTINDLFLALAEGVEMNDPIDTTLRIVRLFRDLSGDDTITVERFYGWAERILADFEDVDKNMADATLLFRNISELKAFDDTTFLTEEQVAELQRFFREFTADDKSILRERYRLLWDTLGDLYRRLNDELSREGLAYEGALYRRIVERLAEGATELDPTIECYVFVGFNVLDKVEANLFQHLKKEGRALFYWDYDNYYVDSRTGNEAGTFLRENLLAFPCALPPEHYDNMAQPKRIEMVAASTEAIQAQYVAPWLEENLTADAKETAVVLCNETLLQPVLHGLPESITELNVTKGFPLSHTKIVTDIEHQFSLWERQGNQRPMGELISELAAIVERDGRAFVNSEGYDETRFEDILQSEAYYQMFTFLNRFAAVASHFEDLEMNVVTLRRLLRQVVRQASIPFHGEPAVGLQVMGVLETRCLDFDHVLVLSANDGMIPHKSRDTSFIPYLLRKAYGLTTPERRTAVYAYYFYRLLQRASVVTLSYNNATDGMTTGEMSRFMTQLLVEWPGEVVHRSLNSHQHSATTKPVAVDKPADILARLTREDKNGVAHPTLSPSALSVYLKCPLKFYYQQVLHLHEPEVETDDILPNVFGTIFHRAAEQIYQHIIHDNGGIADGEHLRALANDEGALAAFVRDAFEHEKTPYRVLEARVLEVYLAHMLRYDARERRFRVLNTERSAACLLKVDGGDGEEIVVRIKGTIDRLDFLHTEQGDFVRVLDYKTGSRATISAQDGTLRETSANSLDELFEAGSSKGYMLQTFLYSLMLRHEAQRNEKLAGLLKYPVIPALFFIKYATNPKYVPYLKIEKKVVSDFEEYFEPFVERLKRLVADILDTSHPFVPTEDDKSCSTCPYRMICHKEG